MVIPFSHEHADGFDTVEWAAALPYSNGKVGMMGASYVSLHDARCYSSAAASHLAPNMTASNYTMVWTYQSGASNMV